MRNNNYLISIDGNYDTDFEAEFYLFKLKQIQFIKDLQISKYKVNSNLSTEQIASILSEIREKLNSPNNFIAIIGGIAEPIINDLELNKNTQETFLKFDEISRIYSQIRHKCKMTNFILFDKNQNIDILTGFRKIDTMNISLGFNFNLINVEGAKLLENYKEMLEILTKEGWEVPPFEK